MGCRCNERRQDLGTAAKAAATGDLKTAGAAIGNAGRTLAEDAAAGVRAAGQRMAAAHARLRRRP